MAAGVLVVVDPVVAVAVLVVVVPVAAAVVLAVAARARQLRPPTPVWRCSTPGWYVSRLESLLHTSHTPHNHTIHCIAGKVRVCDQVAAASDCVMSTSAWRHRCVVEVAAVFETTHTHTPHPRKQKGTAPHASTRVCMRQCGSKKKKRRRLGQKIAMTGTRTQADCSR